jgi:hypothetical protein
VPLHLMGGQRVGPRAGPTGGGSRTDGFPGGALAGALSPRERTSGEPRRAKVRQDLGLPVPWRALPEGRLRDGDRDEGDLPPGEGRSRARAATRSAGRASPPRSPRAARRATMTSRLRNGRRDRSSRTASPARRGRRHVGPQGPTYRAPSRREARRRTGDHRGEAAPMGRGHRARVAVARARRIEKERHSHAPTPGGRRERRFPQWVVARKRTPHRRRRQASAAKESRSRERSAGRRTVAGGPPKGPTDATRPSAPTAPDTICRLSLGAPSLLNGATPRCRRAPQGSDPSTGEPSSGFRNGQSQLGLAGQRQR